MKYDDDALERALSALPLEEAPPDLHARIMAATVHAPVMAPVLRMWEIYVIGVALAVATWLVLVSLGVPLAGGHAAMHELDEAAALASTLVSTLFSKAWLPWLAVGGSAAIWLSQLTLPQGRGGTAEG